MGKPILSSIYMYEKKGRIWVEAEFKRESSEDHIGKIDVRFSLPKEDPRDVAGIEELAITKANKVLKKTKALGLMK